VHRANHDKIGGHSVARCACIDVGSNTTRLLVAVDDGPGLRELFSERAFTRLGAACGGDGTIGAAKIAEVAEVVARQAAIAQELGAQTLRVVATAAVRQAVDAAQLAAAIERRCGATLEVLAGDDEARLAFAGAVGMLATAPAGPIGVVDVGGGSTELVIGTSAGGVTWSVSLPVGSSVVTESDLPTDPPPPAELARARHKLATMFQTVEVPRPAAAYAVGGSATSLQRLVGSLSLERAALARGLQALTTRPAAEIALRLGLHPERARLLPAGILLLDAASRAMQAHLQLAGGGLREGVVLEQLAALRRDES
jgi:exopolyphosphatase/guanosine-5'-triphosphate,3'-diphosphate pyrophosphatase